MPSTTEFLIGRLASAGVRHVFGVTGEYVSDLCRRLNSHADVKFVPTADEVGAGYAADAYARMTGIGCVVASFNVGALKLANVVAAAYAERSPLIVISGGPPSTDRMPNLQAEIFSHLTCAHTVLNDPSRAGYEIDRLLEALRHHKRPVYIELPTDIADRPVTYDVYRQGTPTSPTTDPENMQEAIQEVADWVRSANRPVILAGVEVARFNLGERLVKFCERSNVPVAATLLSKSVFPERHPLYLGLYQGSFGQEGVRDAVENSDCLMMFGVMNGDLSNQFLPQDVRKRNAVGCTVDGLKIKNHAYQNVQFVDFMNSFLRLEVISKNARFESRIFKGRNEYVTTTPDREVTVDRFFQKVNSVLTPEMVVISDVGNSLWGSSELMVHTSHGFLGSALYRSMGGSVPGALGVALADPKVRPIVVVGDGAMQMATSEIGTFARHGVAPIIFVLNNEGYVSERSGLASGPHTDVSKWEYHRLMDVVGGQGFDVSTEGELDQAVATAIKSNVTTLVNVRVGRDGQSHVLSRVLTGR